MEKAVTVVHQHQNDIVKQKMKGASGPLSKEVCAE